MSDVAEAASSVNALAHIVGLYQGVCICAGASMPWLTRHGAVGSMGVSFGLALVACRFLLLLDVSCRCGCSDACPCCTRNHWPARYRPQPFHCLLVGLLRPLHRLLLAFHGPFTAHSLAAANTLLVLFPASFSLLFGSIRVAAAVGVAVILLHPPPPFSRCFNSGGEGMSAK